MDTRGTPALPVLGRSFGAGAGSSPHDTLKPPAGAGPSQGNGSCSSQAGWQGAKLAQRLSRGGRAPTTSCGQRPVAGVPPSPTYLGVTICLAAVSGVWGAGGLVQFLGHSPGMQAVAPQRWRVGRGLATSISVHTRGGGPGAPPPSTLRGCLGAGR